jgi:hypothetical protein
MQHGDYSWLYSIIPDTHAYCVGSIYLKFVEILNVLIITEEREKKISPYQKNKK